MKPDYIDIEDIVSPQDEDDITESGLPYHILIEGWTDKIYDRNIPVTNLLGLFCDNLSFYKNAPTETIPYLFIEDYAFDSVKDKRKVNDSIFALFKQILYTKADQITASLVRRKDSKYAILHQERVSLNDLQVSGKLDFLGKRNIEIIKSFSSAIKAIEDVEYCKDNNLCDIIKECRQKYENDNVKNKEFLTIRQHSSKGIPTDIITIMEKVVKRGRARFLTLFDNLLPCHFNDPLPIPIYLLDPSDMPTYGKLWGDIKDIEKYIPQYNVLGYYIREDASLCDKPHIVLCPENIEACAGKNITLGNLFTKVLVHEISHSVLDKYYEYKLYSDLFSDWNLEAIKVTENHPQSKCARAMEESLANMMTLQWIESTGDSKLFSETMSFIKNQQPAFYQFGIYQYNAKVDWRKWRKSSKQKTQELEDWFNKCFVDAEIRIHEQDYTKVLFDKAIVE